MRLLTKRCKKLLLFCTIFYGYNYYQISKLLDGVAILEKYKYDVCVVGSGFAGSVLAERYANDKKRSVLVLEKKNHLGGIYYDYVDPETNIRVSKYGPHFFHTRVSKAWSYVQQFGEWVPYEHTVRTVINGTSVPMPINMDSVNNLYNLNFKRQSEMIKWMTTERNRTKEKPNNAEELVIGLVGERMYELIFKPYLIKQWGKQPKKLGAYALPPTVVRTNTDDRQSKDPFQGLPRDGYTSIIKNMLRHPNITVWMNADYLKIRSGIECEKVFYTDRIDSYFEYLNWKKLEYRSVLYKKHVKKNTEFFQTTAVMQYPQANLNYTRIIEYKHLLNQTSPHTVYFEEWFQENGEPLYPVPNKDNMNLFDSYKEMSKKEEGVFFVGQFAQYKKLEIAEEINNALTLFRDSALLDQFDGTNWCVLHPDFLTMPTYFNHFPHAAENLLPCWSWFRRQNVTNTCGFILQNKLKLDAEEKNTWQKQLVDAMGCKVKEFEYSFRFSESKKFHAPSLQLKLPRFAHKVYLERPEDAHALRRLIVPQSVIDEVKGEGKPLQIGIIQRTQNRRITNMREIVSLLSSELPDANITETTFQFSSLKKQAEFFATKDVIIAAHGAALTNALFITRGTIVMQIYPKDFFWQSIDPLIEQAGGIALDWFHGTEPHLDWQLNKWEGNQNIARESSISPPPNEVVNPILFALGKRTATIFPLRDEFGEGDHLPLYKAARKEQDAKINEQENKIYELNLQIESLLQMLLEKEELGEEKKTLDSRADLSENEDLRKTVTKDNIEESIDVNEYLKTIHSKEDEAVEVLESYWTKLSKNWFRNNDKQGKTLKKTKKGRSKR